MTRSCLQKGPKMTLFFPPSSTICAITLSPWSFLCFSLFFHHSHSVTAKIFLHYMWCKMSFMRFWPSPGSSTQKFANVPRKFTMLPCAGEGAIGVQNVCVSILVHMHLIFSLQIQFFTWFHITCKKTSHYYCKKPLP